MTKVHHFYVITLKANRTSTENTNLTYTNDSVSWIHKVVCRILYCRMKGVGGFKEYWMWMEGGVLCVPD